MLRILRRVGGSLVVTVPQVFAEQNGLHQGSEVDVKLSGRTMTVEAIPRRYKLADLMAEMPQGLPRVDGFDELPPIGLEQG